MKNQYKQYFIDLLGVQDACFDDLHKISYSFDATKQSYKPDGVLFPKDEKDVQNILKFCNENKIIIIPRGAGSGFSGGALAINGGLILAFEKYMNKILKIDLENLTATVQPGLINGNLQKELKKYNLFYPPDPASFEYCSIGGNVSENSGGMKAVKYGVTKDYVLSLNAVLPNGDLIKVGKNTIKDVAGYNLVGTLIASEGTLAIITEITLKLLAIPNFQKTALGIFDDTQKAMNAVYKTFSNGVIPVCLEFLDDLSINALKIKFDKKFDENAKTILIVLVDGNVKEAIDYDLKKLEEIFKQEGAIDFNIGKDQAQEDDIWFLRKNCSQSMSVYGNIKLNEDISVPRSNLAKLLQGIKEISIKYGFKIPCFGHAGDGNVHVNIMLEDENKLKLGHKAVDELFDLVLKLNGTLSGEHGIGISKAPYMNLAFSKEELNLMKNIKKAFDPNNILNPFKMGI